MVYYTKYMVKILFVCTGNVCRSFTAHKLLEHFQKQSGGPPVFEVKSCGIGVEPYFRVPAETADFLKAQGIEDVTHKPELVHEELVEWADIILVMDNMQYEVLADKFPQSGRKMHLLKEYAGDKPREECPAKDLEIRDPMGKGKKVFEKVLGEIKGCVEKIIKAVDSIK